MVTKNIRKVNEFQVQEHEEGISDGRYWERYYMRPATQNEINRERVRVNDALAQSLAPDLMREFWELLDQQAKWKEDVIWARHFPLSSDISEGEAKENLKRVTIQLDYIANKIVRLLDRYERRQERQQNSFVDLDDITEDIPEPIPGLPFDVYPNSIVLVYGMSQNRKSYLALHLAARMAERGENVVIYQNEGAKANTAARLKAWQAEYPDSPTNRNKTLKLLDTDNISLDLSDNESVDEFIEAMYEYSPSMIVIDALTGAYEGEENSNSDLKVVFENIRYIKDQLETIVVLIDNTGKDKTRGARGAQVKFDKADTVIYVETKDDKTRVRYDKQRFGEKGNPVTFIWREHTVQQGRKQYKQIAPAGAVSPDTRSLILDCFEDTGGESLTFSQIKAITGLHNQTLTRNLKDMVQEGILHKTRSGSYKLPETE